VPKSASRVVTSRRHLRPGRRAAPVRRLSHHGVRLIRGALIDDRCVLAGIGDAEVDAVGEYIDDGLPPGMPPAYRLPGLCPALEP
jgi:hypothetical protein